METKLEDIFKKMAHLNVRDLPARIQSHSAAHERHVKAKLSGLPYDCIKDLKAMDTLLTDLNLAISLVSCKQLFPISFISTYYLLKFR